MKESVKIYIPSHHNSYKGNNTLSRGLDKVVRFDFEISVSCC